MCSLTSSFYYSDGDCCVPARLTNLRRKRSSAMCLLLFRYTADILNLFYVFEGHKNASAVFYRMNSNGIGATTTTRLRDPIQEQGGLNLYAFVGNLPTIKLDRLGQDVWIENTPAAGGWHRRVCVNTWARSYVVTNLWGIKFCCHENIKYVKTGKYCISFGDKDLDVNYSSGNCEAVNTPSRNFYVPPHGFEHAPGGSGVVYSDNEYPATSSHVSFRQQCDRDIRALDYMRSLIGMEGNYTVLWNNCRDFSEALFEYLISEEF